MYGRKLMHKEYLKKSELESWIFVDWHNFNLFMWNSLWAVYCFQASDVLFIYVKNWQVE